MCLQNIYAIFMPTWLSLGSIANVEGSVTSASVTTNRSSVVTETKLRAWSCTYDFFSYDKTTTYYLQQHGCHWAAFPM